MGKLYILSFTGRGNEKKAIFRFILIILILNVSKQASAGADQVLGSRINGMEEVNIAFVKHLIHV